MHTILYRSLDYAGNWEAAQECTVCIDTRPPRPIADWAASARREGMASLRYRVDDPRPGSPTADVAIRVRTLAGRLVRKLVVRAVPVETPLVAQFLVPRTWRSGIYRFYVCATDQAGNPQMVVASNTLTVRWTS